MVARRFAQTARIGSASVLAAGALLMTAPAPAHADPLINPETTTDTDLDYSSSTPVCSYAGSPVPVGTDVPFAADGLPHTQTSSYAGTVTNNSSPSDITAVSASATHTVTASQVGGALSHVAISDSLSATTNPQLGSAQLCEAEADADSNTAFQFALSSPKWALIEIESKEVTGQVDLDIMTINDPSYSETGFGGPHFHRTERVYLAPGEYAFDVEPDVGTEAPFPGGGQVSRSGRLDLTLDLVDPGSATTPADGDGGKYVDLAATRGCANGTLAGTWTGKAGKGKHAKVKKATFYVNGAKAKKVKKPKKKSVTTLAGLAPDQAADVLVKLKLAKKGAGTVTVERSYLPCT